MDYNSMKIQYRRELKEMRVEQVRWRLFGIEKEMEGLLSLVEGRKECEIAWKKQTELGILIENRKEPKTCPQHNQESSDTVLLPKKVLQDLLNNYHVNANRVKTIFLKFKVKGITFGPPDSESEEEEGGDQGQAPSAPTTGQTAGSSGGLVENQQADQMSSSSTAREAQDGQNGTPQAIAADDTTAASNDDRGGARDAGENRTDKADAGSEGEEPVASEDEAASREESAALTADQAARKERVGQEGAHHTTQTGTSTTDPRSHPSKPMNIIKITEADSRKKRSKDPGWVFDNQGWLSNGLSLVSKDDSRLKLADRLTIEIGERICKAPREEVIPLVGQDEQRSSRASPDLPSSQLEEEQGSQMQALIPSQNALKSRLIVPPDSVRWKYEAVRLQLARGKGNSQLSKNEIGLILNTASQIGGFKQVNFLKGVVTHLRARVKRTGSTSLQQSGEDTMQVSSSADRTVLEKLGNNRPGLRGLFLAIHEDTHGVAGDKFLYKLRARLNKIDFHDNYKLAMEELLVDKELLCWSSANRRQLQAGDHAEDDEVDPRIRGLSAESIGTRLTVDIEVDEEDVEDAGLSRRRSQRGVKMSSLARANILDSVLPRPVIEKGMTKAEIEDVMASYSHRRGKLSRLMHKKVDAGKMWSMIASVLGREALLLIDPELGDAQLERELRDLAKTELLQCIKTLRPDIRPRMKRLEGLADLLAKGRLPPYRLKFEDADDTQLSGSRHVAAITKLIMPSNEVASVEEQEEEWEQLRGQAEGRCKVDRELLNLREVPHCDQGGFGRVDEEGSVEDVEEGDDEEMVDEEDGQDQAQLDDPSREEGEQERITSAVTEAMIASRSDPSSQQNQETADEAASSALPTPADRTQQSDEEQQGDPSQGSDAEDEESEEMRGTDVRDEEQDKHQLEESGGNEGGGSRILVDDDEDEAPDIQEGRQPKQSSPQADELTIRLTPSKEAIHHRQQIEDTRAPDSLTLGRTQLDLSLVPTQPEQSGTPSTSTQDALPQERTDDADEFLDALVEVEQQEESQAIREAAEQVPKLATAEQSSNRKRSASAQADGAKRSKVEKLAAPQKKQTRLNIADSLRKGKAKAVRNVVYPP